MNNPPKVPEKFDPVALILENQTKEVTQNAPHFSGEGCTAKKPHGCIESWHQTDTGFGSIFKESI